MTAPPHRSGRRSPNPTSRRRDPQRSREQILRAAAEVFAEKGYAGARVRDIAARAGVNAQLISYYFGGKLGLYRAIGEQWREREGAEIPAGTSLPELIAAYVRINHEYADYARLLVWQAFVQPPDAEDAEPTPGPGRADVTDLRRRQRAGELARGIDPEIFLLVMTAAALAPVSLPNLVRQICGAEPDSEQFVERYAKQLSRIVSHLAEPGR